MPQIKVDQLIGAHFAFQHYAFEHVAEILRGFGFKEIELWGIAPHLDLFHATDAQVRSVRDIVARNGFTPEQVIYPINIASGAGAYRRDSVRRFCHAADICAELGAKYLFLTSGRGYEHDPPQDAWARSAQSLAEIAAYTASVGVRCLLEPLHRVETNVVTNASGLRRMLDQIGADTIDVVLDTVGMATAGDTVADYVRLFGPRLAHVQIVDGLPAGHLVWGDGKLPIGQYLHELAASGYRGKMTFEPFGNGSYALDPVAAWNRNLKAIEPHMTWASTAA
ncbi:sugar phosphate isomerase/epimerase family protein [Mesorhizobium salmacidum]|uniref:TIM barrel protein n=1 Tax=Mesorhizobium salmacidum TaxID=3015171 RepID=A0ABU8L448_9HYPH